MKYSGNIGFVQTSETTPGVWTPTIKERHYCGDILSKSFRWDSSSEVNDNYTISNRISIVMDDFIQKNLGYAKYVTLYGSKWKISDITLSYPRAEISLGGLYHD